MKTIIGLSFLLSATLLTSCTELQSTAIEKTQKYKMFVLNDVLLIDNNDKECQNELDSLIFVPIQRLKQEIIASKNFDNINPMLFKSKKDKNTFQEELVKQELKRTYWKTEEIKTKFSYFNAELFIADKTLINLGQQNYLMIYVNFNDKKLTNVKKCLTFN